MNDPVDPPSRLLSGDPRELDRKFEEFQATPASNMDERRERFDGFAAELHRHIVVEERLLFPPFGEGDSSRRLLVELMLDEHRRIEDVLQRIRDRLDSGPRPTEDLESELVNVLWAHNTREEESVYPWFDAHLPVDVVQAVGRELHDPGAKGHGPR